MVDQHARVVLLINMVAREDHHILGLIAADDIQVLRHRVRRAAIPVFAVYALLGWQQIDKLVHLFAEERPAALDMLHQRVRLILGNNADTTDP